MQVLVKDWCEMSGVADKIIVTMRDGKRIIRIRDVKNLKAVLRDFCDTFDEEYNTMRIYHYLEKKFSLDTIYEVTLDEKVNIGLEKSTEFGKFQYTVNFICNRLTKTSNIETVGYIADHTFYDGYWMADEELNNMILPTFNNSDFTYLTKKLKGLRYDNGALLIDNYKGLEKKLAPFAYKGKYYPVNEGYRWPKEIEVIEKEYPSDPEIDDFFKLYPDAEVVLDSNRHYLVSVKTLNGYVNMVHHYSKYFNDKSLALDFFNKFKPMEDIKTKLGLYKITFRHEYLYKNKQLANSVYTLVKNINFDSLTGNKLFVLNYYTILARSVWNDDSQGLILADEYYFYLGIDLDALQESLTTEESEWLNTTYYPKGKQEGVEYKVRSLYKSLFGVNIRTPYYIAIEDEFVEIKEQLGQFEKIKIEDLEEPLPEIRVDLSKYQLDKKPSYMSKVQKAVMPSKVTFETVEDEEYIDPYDYESEMEQEQIVNYAEELSKELKRVEVDLSDYMQPREVSDEEVIQSISVVTLLTGSYPNWTLTIGENSKSYELYYDETLRNYGIKDLKTEVVMSYRDINDVIAALVTFDESIGFEVVNAEKRVLGAIYYTLGIQNYDFDYFYNKIKGVVGLKKECEPRIHAYIEEWVKYDMNIIMKELGIDSEEVGYPEYDYGIEKEEEIEDGTTGEGFIDFGIKAW